MKREEQLAGPPAPPLKRQKTETETISDSLKLQLTSGPSTEFRKLHRRDLIDFFLREAEARSCKDLLSFIGDSELLETAVVPGATSDKYKDYRKPSDVLKHLSHQFINFFSDLQLCGWSFCGKVDISDVLVTPLGHIRMRTSKKRSLKPQSNRRNRKDFRCLVRVFLKVLERVERIPADFIHLLNLLKNFSEKDRILITHNPANMTEQERLSLLDRLFRSYEALADNDVKLKAITDAIPYGDVNQEGHYKVRAKTNIFLVGVLKYKNPLWLAVPKKNKKKKSLYPETGRGVLKLNRNSMQHAFKGLGTEDLEPRNETEDNDKNEDDDTVKKKTKRKRPPKKQRIKVKKPVRVQRFQPIQVDHMLGNTFPGLLCAFAKIMNDVGLYEEVIQDLKLPAPGDSTLEPQPSSNPLELQTGKGGELTHDETTIIAGALELSEKKAKDAMTPLCETFVIDINAKLDRKLMKEVIDKGHSRVPVYYEKEANIIGLILVKNLLSINPDDEIPIKSVTIRKIPRVSEDLPLYAIVNEFQKGHSHMAVVIRQNVPNYPAKQLNNDDRTLEVAAITIDDKRGDKVVTNLPPLQRWESYPNTLNSNTGSRRGEWSKDQSDVLQVHEEPLPTLSEDEEAVGIITMEDVIEATGAENTTEQM